MPTLGPLLLQKTWTFQTLIAFPTFFVLGLSAMIALWDGGLWSVYDFVADLCTSLMAAGIIFIVMVQKQLGDPVGSAEMRGWTCWLEGGKAGLATGLWVWLMADSIWAPERGYGDYRRRRIVCSAIAVVLLFLFFYPTVWYAFYVSRRDSHGQEVRVDEERGEREPLLRNE